METKLPFFISPDHMEGFKIADNDGSDNWKLFKKELPPVDEMIWIIDKAGAVGFGCRRKFGLFALCFKDRTPIAWKKRTIGAPSLKFK
jgi:hypothetical protein